MQQDAKKQPRGRTSMQNAKPFPVTQQQVWDAWKRVKENQGGAGMDGQSIAEFEENLEDNIYKIWNRMASGSYHPQAVRLAGKINATVRGWIDDDGAFFKSELKRLFKSINEHLIRWMIRKYKRFRGHWRRSWRWLEKFARQNSGLFVHWEFLYGPPLLNSKTVAW